MTTRLSVPASALLACVLTLASASPARADGLLLGDGAVAGIEHGNLVNGIRTDGAVRFDPFAPGKALAADGDATEGEHTVYALPLGGDVSGDELEDVLRVEATRDRDGAILGSDVVALSGDTGRELWTAHFGAGVYWGGYLPGDTTGDGTPDLAFVTYENEDVLAQYPPPGLHCFDCQKWALTATTRLLVLDGTQGSIRWEDARSVAYVFNEQPTPQVPVLWRTWVYTNLIAELAALDDLDGDGGRDLLWTPWQASFVGGMGSESTQTAFAAVYSGASGTKRWDRTLRGSGWTPWNNQTPALAGAWPGPDGTGDGIPDLYTSEIDETAALTRLTRKALDATTGEIVWEHSRSWPTDARFLRADYLPLADGELVYVLLANDYRSDVEALDPRTGEVRWAQLPADALFVQPAGDIGADGTADLLYVAFHRDGSFSLSGVDGRTGARLSHRDFAPDDWDWFFLVAPFLDHSGDGVVDVILGGGSKTGAGFEDRWWVTSLADGRALWSVERTGSAPTVLLSGSDFDGRGPADVLEARLHQGADPRIELAGRHGPTGRDLWRHERYRTGPAEETLWDGAVGFMRDANGNRREDFLFASVNLWPRYNGGVADLDVDLVDGKRGVGYATIVK